VNDDKKAQERAVRDAIVRVLPEQWTCNHKVQVLYDVARWLTIQSIHADAVQATDELGEA